MAGDGLAKDGIYAFGQAKVGHKTYTYQQVDGEPVYGEFGWVTDLDYFDERDGELLLLRKKWLLLDVEVITLPDRHACGLCGGTGTRQGMDANDNWCSEPCAECQ